MSTIPT